MFDDQSSPDSPAASLKNEESRQRWELFHRAIAHAKQSNVNALQESDESATDGKRRAPVLSIAR